MFILSNIDILYTYNFKELLVHTKAEGAQMAEMFIEVSEMVFIIFHTLETTKFIYMI